MSKSNDLSSYYHKIYQKIDRFLEDERQASQTKIDWVRMQCYWKVGKLLNGEANKLKIKELRGLRKHLSEKLDYHPRKLHHLQQFHSSWPKSPPAKSAQTALPWSKYLELLSVDDPKAKAFYLKETLSSDWSCLQLRKAIQQDLYRNKNLKRFDQKDLKRQRSLINTFWAQVLRVIDGDTLQVRIDLRFGASLTQEIRLRGINCPELKGPQPEGAKAKAFTENEFKQLQKNSPTQSASKMLAPSWVLIVTYKSDKFGRYVGDIYYSNVYESEDELLRKGQFLNQKLLSADLAKRVEY